MHADRREQVRAIYKERPILSLRLYLGVPKLRLRALGEGKPSPSAALIQLGTPT
jgi:hypothetical protein